MLPSNGGRTNIGLAAVGIVVFAATFSVLPASPESGTAIDSRPDGERTERPDE